jgi:hypothetical protein
VTILSSTSDSERSWHLSKKFRPILAFFHIIISLGGITEAAVGTGVRLDPARPYVRRTPPVRASGERRIARGAMAAAAGAMAVLGALLAAAGVNAQVPLPNARQLDFMELELTQFM